MKLACGPVLLALSFTCLLPSLAVAVSLGQIDTFQDGTTQNWTVNLVGLGTPVPFPPTNVATGGPTGAGDRYLQLQSTGTSGASSRLAVINPSQWAGNYLAAGITSVTMNVNNLGSTDLSLRLLFEDPVTGPPQNVAFSSVAVQVPAGSGWMSVTFPIMPADLTAQSGTVSAALSNTTWLRLYHSSLATFPGPTVVATLGVDNIQAVPEPATALLLLGVLPILRRRCSWRSGVRQRCGVGPLAPVAVAKSTRP